RSRSAATGKPNSALHAFQCPPSIGHDLSCLRMENPWLFAPRNTNCNAGGGGILLDCSVSPGAASREHGGGRGIRNLYRALSRLLCAKLSGSSRPCSGRTDFLGAARLR